MNNIEQTPPPLNAQEALTRTWAMICHLAALSGYVIPFGFVLGPLIVWQIKKNQIPGIIPHGREAVNFHISLLIYTAISTALVFVLIGIFILPFLAIFQIICAIIGGLKANDGTLWKYPLTIRFLK